jgi:hypothetical protein
MITQARLKELFEYRDGALYNIKSRNTAKAGCRAGTTSTKGYRKISVDRKIYSEHHLVWLYHYGIMPKKLIDHINRIRDDNRIENLREVTLIENCHNRNISKHNKSGAIGVSYHSQTGKWKAVIQYNRKGHYLGLFDTVEEATKAYYKKKSEFV